MDDTSELKRWKGLTLWLAGRLSVVDPAASWDEWIERADQDVRQVYELPPIDMGKVLH